MLKFTHLHYEQNWFTAFFSMMKKVVKDPKSGQAVMSCKQTWGNSFLAYGDGQFGNLLVEARFLRKAAFEWDVYEAGKPEPFAHMKSYVFRGIMAMGCEVLSVTTPDGRDFLKLEREEKGILKHVVDDMIDLYNPTHVYTLKDASGKKIGSISVKHGIFTGTYDFVMEAGTEKERAAALIAFAYILLSMKK